MRLLHVDSGILGDNSVSRRLSAAVVASWRAAHSHTHVVYRDLVAAPLPHLTGELMAAAQVADPTQHSLEVRHALAIGSKVLEEFMSANVVVVGAPMYNFGVPSQLKAWIDRLAVGGRTFKYTEKGPVGLVGDKKVIVASARGGLYGPDSPFAALDHQEKYLSTIFRFFGISDIRFVRAEGVNLSAEARQASIAQAEEQLSTVLAA
jgi:FMN-dependent NADH-azoreductase